MAHVAGSSNFCVACHKETHPSTCGKFQGMSREERWALVKGHGCCMNCLKVGHMANKCRARPACKKCSKTHHTLLHVDVSKPLDEGKAEESASSVTHVPQPKGRKRVLLMTCKAKITGPKGNAIVARVFLDPGASCSFISERLVKQLKLPRRKDNSLIAGIAGVNATRTRGAVSFSVSHVRGKGKRIH